MNLILNFVISLIIFLLLDFTWLGFIAKDLYKNNIGFLMTENINWAAAITFYLIYVWAINFFVVTPSIEKNSLYYAITAGALFGFTAYATYDLTNLATLKNWPLTITIIDLAWGAILTGAVSGLTFLISSKF